ncbi:hypothetical protein HX773_24610 [Pantoea sp. B9002]|uniref:hypothetical protein n=1 Tax=Pantoea sp. B9002 TaxID=2726979 RepID=UPI0015A3541A|nr:hypothetical protein [Pantoea sp. B9002]NWA64084.1 hypothetical protein [Pantoea sp. B9002]
MKMNRHAAVLVVWGSLLVADFSFALPPSTPQYLLNQQVQSNNFDLLDSDSTPPGRGGIPVIDGSSILKMKQDAWKEWNSLNNTNISFEVWNDNFNQGLINAK